MTDRPTGRDPTVDLPPADDPTRTAAHVPEDPTRTTELPADGGVTPKPGHTPYDRPTAERDNPTATFDPDFRPTAEPPGLGGLMPPAQKGAGQAPGGRVGVPGYELLGELGRGGMGVVWKARHVALDRVVALKMILGGANAPPSLLARFRDEARAVAKFQHPHIVQVFEVGEFAGLPYFSLEYVDGGTLSKKIAREPQPPRYAAGVVETLARAVQYAHDRNVIHRDLKPGNVLLAADGTVKLTDFGLAKQVEGDSGTTQSGQVVGTPSFMAPEQAEGRSDVGRPADVWALGAILYDLLTGRPPFTGSSVLDTLEMVRTREPVSPGQLAAHVPRDVETICLKCLQKEPAKRYASARDLADDLRRFLDGRPIVARPVPGYERAWRWAKRNKAVAGLWSLAAVLLLATAVTGTTFAVVFERQKERERTAKVAAEAARDEERKAKEEAEAANTARRETNTPMVKMVRQVSVFLDDQLRDKASLAPLRKRVLELVIAGFGEMRAATAKYPNPLEERTDGVNYTRLADVMLRAGEVTTAGELVGRATAILAKAVKDYPDDPVHLRNLAAVTNTRADVALRLGDAARARDLYAEALKLREAWSGRLADAPAWNRAEARRAVAQSHFLIGVADLERGDPAAAARSLAAAEREYAGLPAGHEAWDVRVARTEVWDRQGDAALALGKPDEARKHYEASLAARQGMLDRAPRDPGLQRDVALARLTLSDFALTVSNDPAAAWAGAFAATEALDRLLKADPDSLPLRRDVAFARYKLGGAALKLTALGGLFGPAVAADQFAECNRLRAGLAEVDGRDAHARVEWMLSLGRCGKAAAARALGWALERTAAGDRRIQFQVACGYAVAAGGAADPAEAGRCRDRAVTVLKELVARGWKDRHALGHDPDLEAVRADPAFQKLMAAVPTPGR